MILKLVIYKRLLVLCVSLVLAICTGTCVVFAQQHKHHEPTELDEGLPTREMVLPQNIVKGTGQIHASTLAVLEDGTVICAAYDGSKEGHKDVNIVVNRRTSAGWSKPQLVTESGKPHWNPVLFEIKPGHLWLMYKVGKSPDNWVTMVRESTDQGVSWSNARRLVATDKRFGRGPVKNKPLRLRSGRVLAPGSVERDGWRAFIDYTDDNGLTWKRSNFIEATGFKEKDISDRGVIQPTLWQDERGDDVHMLLRSTEGFIYKSDSKNDGKTWCPAYPTVIPNNNSGLDLVRNPDDGILYLVCNPITDGLLHTKRTPLSLLFSRDNGQTWAKMCDLENGKGEYSYPAVVAYNGSIIISYTWLRQNIAVRYFTPKQLLKFRLLSATPY
jgi:predicted neuraminidase